MRAGSPAGVAVDAVHLAEQVAGHHRASVTAREEGRRRLGRELHDHLGPTVAGLPELSAREHEVLGLLAQGLTNNEIGARPFISPITVRNHVSRRGR